MFMIPTFRRDCIENGLVYFDEIEMAGCSRFLHLAAWVVRLSGILDYLWRSTLLIRYDHRSFV
jgi:hypothetical protein